MVASTGVNGQQFSPADSRPQLYAWMLHPAIDLLFACGGILWIFLLVLASGLVPNLADPNGKDLASVTIFTFVFLTLPHQPATYVRVLNSSESRQAFGKKVALLAGLCTFLGVCAAVSPFAASIVGRLTFCFSYQHYYSQSYGVALLYCAKRGYRLTDLEKKLLSFMTQSAVFWGAARLLSRPELQIGGLTLEKIGTLPDWVGNGLEAAFFCSVIAFAGVIARKWLKERQFMPFPSILTLISTFFFLGYLPDIAHNGWLFAVGILGQAFLHTGQYLVVTTSFHLKEIGLPQGVSVGQISRLLLRPVAFKYYTFLIAAGFLCSLLGPLLRSMGEGVGLRHELLACAIFCALNLHHYWSDSVIWKMKDKHTRTVLLA